ncbi:MAG: hypothetical protein M1830_002347 [Pleopsidium flavum]|nr:MAG: hypothetical protein M1830_002347 [Pleopsidium flavum]
MLRSLDRSLAYRGILPSLQDCAWWLFFLPPFPLLGLLHSPLVICVGGSAFYSGNSELEASFLQKDQSSDRPFEPEDAGFEVVSTVANGDSQEPQEFTLTQLMQGRSAWELPEEESVPPTDGGPNEDLGLEVGASLPDISNRARQRYNRRGYPINPESRAFARTSRRAQNDVLSTVGICVGVHEDGRPADAPFTLGRASKRDAARIESVRKENEIGLLMSAASHGIFFLSHWWIVGVNNRIQTFSFYSGIPLTQVLKIECEQFGLFKLLFAGCPAFMVQLLLAAIRELVKHYDFESRSLRSQDQTREQGQFGTVSRYVDGLLGITGFILIAPFEIFSILQLLDLVPARPLLPLPRSLIPFSRYSPLQLPVLPNELTAKSFMTFASSIIRSPALMLWTCSFVNCRIEHKLFTYFRNILPKPEDPDVYSVKGALQDNLDQETIPGLKSVLKGQEAKNFLCKLAFDLRHMRNGLLGFLGLNREELGEEQAPFNVLPNTSQEANEPQAESSGAQDESLCPGADEHEAPMASSTSEVFTQLSDVMHRSAGATPLADVLEIDSTYDITPQTADQDMVSSTTEDTPLDPAANHNGVRVSNRHRNTDTVTMEVEISGRPPNVQLRGRPVFTTNSGANPRSGAEGTTQEGALHASRQSDSKEPKRRVTVLSGHIADALASHLAYSASKILCLPLEALLMRTIALGFLAAAKPTPSAQTTALGLRQQVYPLNAWFGLGLRGAGWNGVGDYVAKMMLCSAVEAAMGFGVWQLGSTACFWIGTRWFEWGRL